MARPKKDIDPEQVRKLAAIDCSYEEIAAVLGCSVRTISGRFCQVIQKAREEGKSSLKRKQFQVAMEGNVTMLIWLGKIRLDQREPRQDIGITGANGEPLIPMAVAREAVEIATKRGLTLVRDDGDERKAG